MKTPFNEELFKALVEPHLLRCRDGDWNHAQRVVKWVKELGNGRNDINLLVIAAYIHDIGWRDVLPSQKLSFDKLLEFEEKANQNSKPFIIDLLTSLKYTKSEITIILDLVDAADAHKSNTETEAIIVDADNLSKLDINHLKEKFLREEWIKMYELWKEKFPNRMRTTKGKELYPSLLEKLKMSIDSELGS
ncbi:HD domain-containing protein [candidate division WWE3 bacterium]|nr:HD domain-containing protein [candidate division WWE3 bacterium]